jgi:hypothetical protein
MGERTELLRRSPTIAPPQAALSTLTPHSTLNTPNYIKVYKKQQIEQQIEKKSSYRG